jgi:TolB-like protein/Tfp pilus assembly protein PilF
MLVIGLLLNGGGLRRLLHREAGAGRIRSLAVLPLQNLSRDPEQEYFADGMTEELIASLATLEGVSVISRTSVMKYKGTRESLPQIARELGVDAVIEGSAMNAGGRVRVTAQLIDASHDRHLWANHYERDLKDVLALQDDLAQAIAGEIRVAIAPGAESEAERHRVVDPAAYEAYLRGRYLWNQRQPHDLEAAIEQFKRATALDSTYALAHAGLAQTYVLMSTYANWPTARVDSLTRAAATRALRLDNRLAGAHAALAQARFYFEWNWEAAGLGFRRALELNPSDATVHHWYALYLESLGKNDASLQELRVALRLDPLSSIIRTATVDHLILMRRFGEAESELAELLRLDPGFPSAYVEEFVLAESIGQFERAIRAHAVFDSLTGAPPAFARDLRRAYLGGGERSYWRTDLGQVRTLVAKGELPLAPAAVLEVRLGEFDTAIDLLERAVALRQDAAVSLAHDWWWDPLRQNPRFRALLRRVGVPQ